MKVYSAAAFAAVIGAVSAAKDERTFGVLNFNNKYLTKGRMDPIVSPGKTSAHVHNILGSSGFSMSATGEDLVNGKCTNGKVKEDMSSYWFPSLYFRDPKTKKFEDVELYYAKVYYFFDATNDDIQAFPLGLQMVAGDAMTRTAPKGGSATNLDASKGDIVNAKFTCPRLNNVYDPPSWPESSDGSDAGIGDPVNKGEGVGFPDVNCDGTYSPLRADIHFPSCYKKSAELNDYENNMAWPSDAGDGKLDCPEGYTHVPHLFLEAYWDTTPFADRWTSGEGTQPFVLSNGDATGFSSHADFMSGWDTDVLQNIIDNCNAGHDGLETCGGATENDEDCTIPSEVDEKVDGILDALPNHQPLLGWTFGLDGLDKLMGGGSESDAGDAASSSSTGLPDEPIPTQPIENLAAEQPKSTVSVKATSTKIAVTDAHSTATTKTVTKTTTITLAADAAEPTDAGNSTGTVAGFQYAGCFKDTEARVLNALVRPDIGKVSNEACVSKCKEAGFLLAGTEYSGECYCGNELIGSSQLDDSDCSMPCKGDSSDLCGGDWALSVYSESGEASLKKSTNTRRHIHHGHRHHARRGSF